MKRIILSFCLLFFIILLLNGKSNNYAYVTSESGLILRSGATTRSEKITTIPYKAKVQIINNNGPKDTIYGISSRWYKVKFKDKTGWVFGGFLKTTYKRENKNEIIDISRITGRYKFNYGQFSPVLILNKDYTFSLTLNVCTGMLNVEGNYKYENDIVKAEVRSCKDCFGFPGVKGMIIRFKRVLNNSLVVQDDVFRIQDGQKFGFCAPNKGDIFRK